MNNILILLAAIISFSFLNPSSKATEELPFGSIEENFIGGKLEFTKVFRNNIEYPDSLKKQKIFGLVFYEFEIDTAGHIIDVKILRGVHPFLDEQVRSAIYVTNGRWKPMIINEKATNYRISNNFYFELR
jgi:protein TonB